MNKTAIKFISSVLSVMLTGSVFSGCGKKEPAVSQQPAATAQTNATTQTNTSGLPIVSKPVTFTYWVPLNANVSAHSASLGDTELYKELEKRTGVKINFKHPAAGQEKDQFNLMIASGDYPDMVEYNWMKDFPGGPEKAIQDGVIIKLNDMINKHAVNLKKVLGSKPEYDKMVKTDSGSYYVFPFLRGDSWLCTYVGPTFRKDWLDELKLQVPTTIDEYYEVLKAFKDKKGATAPFTFTNGGAFVDGSMFMGSFGVVKDFFQDNGKIKYGPVEKGYKDFLELMNKWYKEGLIDPDFATQPGTAMDAKVTGGKAGAFISYAGSGMGRYTKLMREKDPNFSFVAAPYPSLKKGEKAKVGQIDAMYLGGSSVAITTKCKEQETAVKWLDYAYSKEGSILFNFGIENVSYKLDNSGYPKYTDLITKNPDKLPMSQAMGKYMRSSYSGPFVQDKREYEQLLEFPEQVKAITVWSEPENKIKLPPITPSIDESKKMASIYNEIKTYVDEMHLKFILGTEPISNFDKYVEQVKKMGLQEVISIQQSAMDRYNKR